MGMKEETKVMMNSLLVLAIPIILENILQTFLGTVDTYFAGKLTDNAIAGIGVTNLIMNIFISFFTALSVGTTAVISRNYGKKDYENVNRVIMHSFTMGCILGGIIGILCFVFKTPILKVSGADDAVIQYAGPYYLIVAVPCIFLCLQLILSSCLRAIKDTKTPMYVTVISNVINIILNIIFMKMGMGIFGLGLATTLARMTGMILLFIRLKNHDKQIQIKPCKLYKNGFTSILFIGIPAGIDKLIMRIGQLIYNSMIISLGTSAYVAHNVAGTIESYSYIPAMGFGLAICTLVGVSLGENDVQKARRMTSVTYYISAACMIVIGVIFFIFAPQLSGLFTETKEVQEMVVQVLRIIAFFQPFSALVQIMTNVLQGAGDTKFPMYLTFIGIWGIRIGIGYLLAVPGGMGLAGVWCAYATDVTVRGLLLYVRYQRGKWEKIEI